MVFLLIYIKIAFIKWFLKKFLLKVHIVRQPTDWEKIFANDVTNKGLISKTYKQLIQLNIKKQTTQ